MQHRRCHLDNHVLVKSTWALTELTGALLADERALRSMVQATEFSAPKFVIACGPSQLSQPNTKGQISCAEWTVHGVTHDLFGFLPCRLCSDQPALATDWPVGHRHAPIFTFECLSISLPSARSQLTVVLEPVLTIVLPQKPFDNVSVMRVTVRRQMSSLCWPLNRRKAHRADAHNVDRLVLTTRMRGPAASRGVCSSRHPK